jgi:hypothetical protein
MRDGAPLTHRTLGDITVGEIGNVTAFAIIVAIITLLFVLGQ